MRAERWWGTKEMGGGRIRGIEENGGKGKDRWRDCYIGR